MNECKNCGTELELISKEDARKGLRKVEVYSDKYINAVTSIKDNLYNCTGCAKRYNVAIHLFTK